MVSVLAALTFSGLQGLTRLRDYWAVSAARAAVQELVREARMRAVARGGARIILDAPRSEVRVESGSVVLRRASLDADFGVHLDLGRVQTATLVVGPAGVGRMAARSVDLTRGHAQQRIVISAYGRVR